MKTQFLIRVTALVSCIALVSSSGAQSIFGTNLIVNGDAEAGTGSSTGDQVVPIPGWIATGGLTVAQYSAVSVTGGLPSSGDPGPHDRGTNLFSGGPTNAYSYATQSINLPAGADVIDRQIQVRERAGSSTESAAR